MELFDPKTREMKEMDLMKTPFGVLVVNLVSKSQCLGYLMAKGQADNQTRLGNEKQEIAEEIIHRFNEGHIRQEDFDKVLDKMPKFFE
jgi:hypothetical protein